MPVSPDQITIRPVNDSTASIPVDQVYGNMPKVPAPEALPVDRVYQAFQDLQNNPPPAKPKADVGHRMLVEHNNGLLAGEQFTQPHFDMHSKNLVGDAAMNDAGEVGYYDDKKQFVPTDRSKHVMLQDPETGGYKIFNRSPETDLGPINGRMVGLGRFVNEGFATNPVSAGPAIAGKEGLNVLGMGRGVSPEAPAVTSGGSILTAKGAQVVPQTTEGSRVQQIAEGVKDATGVDVNVPKVVASDSKTAHAAGTVASKVPIGGAPLARAEGEMGGQLAHAAESASTIPAGRAVDTVEAGNTAISGIDNYINRSDGVLSQRISNAYDAVKKKFTRLNLTHELNETQKVVSELTNKYKAMGYSDIPTSVKSVLEPLEKKGGLTYDAIRDLRTKIGEMLGSPTRLPSDISTSELRKIYGALKDDTRNLVLRAGGKRATDALDRADKYTRLAHERMDRLDKILGTRGADKAAENVFGKIHQMAGSTSTADSRKLLEVRKSMTQPEWDHITSGVMGRLGINKEGHFDPNQFIKDYAKFSPRGKSVIFGDNTQARAALDGISELSSKWRDTGKYAGGMHHGVSAGIGAGGALLGAEVLRSWQETGGWKVPASILGATFGAGWVSKVMSSPVTARSALNWARRYEALRLRPGSGTLTAFNNASQDLEHKMQRGDNILGQ